MRRKEHKKKRLTHKERRHKYISAIVGVGVIAILVYQCISGLVTGKWIWGLNYYGQPVTPGLQLILLIVLVFIGVVSVWKFFFGKEETKKEKKQRQKAQRKSSHLRYPHQNMPWR